MWTCGVDDQRAALRERFNAGATFEDVLARPKSNSDLWQALYKRASLTPEAAKRAAALPGEWHMLVLNEDWCGDSVNVLPYIARIAEADPDIHLRIIGRDANRDLMDAHLTGTSRSVPVAIVYDENFEEKGWWGPRPGPLQSWVLKEGLALPKPDRYRHIRTWYARDHGRTIVSEILSIMEK